jgi:hypothetical protein
VLLCKAALLVLLITAVGRSQYNLAQKLSDASDFPVLFGNIAAATQTGSYHAGAI